MISLPIKILTDKVPENHIEIFYLGQAGFIFKDTAGHLTAVDLYLTDCVERINGFKRLIPKLLEPDDLVFDNIITTHSHYDHFDIDAIPVMMSCGKTHLYAAKDCRADCERLTIHEDSITYIEVGGTYEAAGVEIEAVFCDHGSLAPYAVGLILTFGEKKVYIAGDTALRPDKAAGIASRKIDVMIAPINGAYGNLNESEAVTLCGIIKPELTIPCHYWNFAEHGGNPVIFENNMKERLPKAKYRVMCMGESIVI